MIFSGYGSYRKDSSNNTIYFKLATIIAATLIKANYIK